MSFLGVEAYPLLPAVSDPLLTISREQVQTCAALVGPDAVPPSVAAERFGVSRWAIYKRRSRAERALGVTFNRPNNMGRRRTYSLNTAAAMAIPA